MKRQNQYRHLLYLSKIIAAPILCIYFCTPKSRIDANKCAVYALIKLRKILHGTQNVSIKDFSMANIKTLLWVAVYKIEVPVQKLNNPYILLFINKST